MIAATIIEQMGGLGKISAMVAGHEFVDGGNSVRFKFKGSRRVNCLKVVLDPSDTYTMTFYRVRGFDYAEVKVVADVYCDQLKPIFEDTTGLYLSL